MASAIEAFRNGDALQFFQLAIGKENKHAINSGRALWHLLENDIKPSDIITRKSFENAIRCLRYWEVSSTQYRISYDCRAGEC
jgi:dihydroxy-acid dehydratase